MKNCTVNTKHALNALLMAGLLLSPTLSHADELFNCRGKIQSAWVDASGLLLINPTWANKSVGLCRLTTKHNNIEPEICTAWVSIALTAVTTQKPTTTQYRVSELSACSAISTYSQSESARYFMMNHE